MGGKWSWMSLATTRTITILYTTSHRLMPTLGKLARPDTPRNLRPQESSLFTEVFSWLPPETPLRQLAVFPSHPKNRDVIAGGQIMSIDEFVAEVRSKVIACGIACRSAISENYPLLRMLQLSHCGYNRAL